ncbi:PH domain-containing protein [Natronorubrum halalkaliphilum]|nr:PH domain-containing protein [Natronorubrum halalkaliphilum]
MALSGAISGLLLPVAAFAILGESVEGIDSSWVFVVAPLGLAIGVGYGIARYYRFSYELTAETFDVTSGVLSVQSREIPYGRVQNVDVRQKLVHRLFGVAVVSIETAGGGDTEATLNFVAEDEANRVQAEIRRLTAAIEADDGDDTRPAPSTEADTSAGDRTDSAEPRAARELLFELEFRELLLYAGTAIRPGAAIFPLFLLLVLTGDPTSLVPESITELSLVALSAIGIVAWALATSAISAAYTVAGYYDFRLERDGNDFVYERGLIERYSGSIPVEKVQSVTISDTLLQRLFGYASLSVETAGYGPGDSSGSQSTVPFAAESRVYRFAEGIAGVERPQFTSHPAMARRRYLARYAILATLVVAAAFLTAQVIGLERWYFAAVAFAAVPPAAHLKWTHMGYYVGDDHLVIRRGFWRRETTVIPYFRIQTVTTRRSLFQRRLGLASLVVDTASSRTFTGSVPTIENMGLEDARTAHENSRKQLQRTLRDRARDENVGLSPEMA